MNLLAISSTPREFGNSEILLNYSTKPFDSLGNEIRIIKLRDLELESCQACDYCVSNGKCKIQDHMDQLYNAFSWCDALIVASPVYYRNINSRLMMVFERYYGVKEKKYLKNKPGGAIAVGRGTSGGQNIVINAIYTWMLSCGMVCVPGELNGLTAVADKPRDIEKQENRIKQALILGENVRVIASKLLKNA